MAAQIAGQHSFIIDIAHPLSDKVSVYFGPRTYSEPPLTFEIAFFKEDAWVKEVVPQFKKYTNVKEETDTRVYSHVPITDFGKFLDNFAIKE